MSHGYLFDVEMGKPQYNSVNVAVICPELQPANLPTLAKLAILADEQHRWDEDAVQAMEFRKAEYKGIVWLDGKLG